MLGSLCPGLSMWFTCLYAFQIIPSHSYRTYIKHLTTMELLYMLVIWLLQSCGVYCGMTQELWEVFISSILYA